MIKKILQLWQGHLEVEIRGNALARFINQINFLGITIWNIKRISYDCYQACIYKDDFNKLRPLLRMRKCQVKIISKKGLPFFLWKIRKRIFLLIGILLVLAIFYIGSSFLWFYDINGLEVIEEAEILNVLKGNGLRRGILKKEIDTAKIENILLKNVTRISWVNVKWIGTLLYIDIVEKKIVEPPQHGELVAAKDGIITKIIVLKGQAAVKEGDTVSVGQVLIVPDTDDVEARGIVKANVWYDAIGEASTHKETILNTGKVKTYWGIKIASNSFWLSKIDLPFDQYKRKKELKKFFVWRNIALPIELIKEEHQEISLIKEYRSFQSTLFLAKEKALAKVLSSLNNGSVIECVFSELVEIEEKDTVKLRILMKVEENIAFLNQVEGGI